jgi:presenilin-like A22 family membrane protease
MSGLSLFGLVAVTAMVVTYALEDRSHWFVLAFAAACIAGSVYGFLQGAWPFGLVEAMWSAIALRRWLRARKVRSENTASDVLAK